MPSLQLYHLHYLSELHSPELSALLSGCEMEVQGSQNTPKAPTQYYPSNTISYFNPVEDKAPESSFIHKSNFLIN